MPRDADALNLVTKWAVTGDVQLPTAAGLTRNEGWPISYSQAGGNTPQRTVFNQLFRELSGLGVEINRYGAGLPWNAALNYISGTMVLGSDGEIYLGRAASGPASTVRDPIVAGNRPSHWQSLSEYIAEQAPGGGGGGGDVFGPVSSVNNEIPLYNGTTGKILGNSGVTLAGIQGRVKQRLYDSRNGVFSTTSQIPFDNTVPLVSEGAEILDISVTTNAATDIIDIDVSIPVVSFTTTNTPITIALFRGSDFVNASCAVQVQGNDDIANAPHLRTSDVPGLGTHNYTVRIGAAAAGTTRVNADDTGASRFNGQASATMTLYRLDGS